MLNEYATMRDAVREYTTAIGAEDPESAWVLSQYDTWEPNPFYTGPAQPHPEDDSEEEEV